MRVNKWSVNFWVKYPECHCWKFLVLSLVDTFPLLTFLPVHETVQTSGCPWVKYFYPPVFIIFFFFFQKPYTVDSPYREILVIHSVLHCLSPLWSWDMVFVFYPGCLLVELSTFGCSCFTDVKTEWLKEENFCLFPYLWPRKEMFWRIVPLIFPVFPPPQISLNFTCHLMFRFLFSTSLLSQLSLCSPTGTAYM